MSNRNYDVTSLGELLIDFTENGTSAQGNPIMEANPGGAPCNVLAMLERLGKKTAFIGKVGKDMFGNQLKAAVEEVGIDTRALIMDEEVHTTLAFVHTYPDGDRDFSFYRNPGADMMLTKDEVPDDLIRDSRIFHFGTLSSTHEGVREATRHAIKVAKEAGCIITFDPNLRPPLWKSLEDARVEIEYGLTKCDVLKISDNEVEFLFDTTDYKTKIAAEVKDFDPRAYMDITEVLRSDAFSQYGVAAACQAVEESGVIGTLPPERVAVYFGSGIGGIRTFTEEHNKLLARGPKRGSPYFIPMLIANMAAGMIAIRFNCRGAAMPSVTACASGTNAIGEAMRAIRHGYADAVITGGSEAAITECGVAGFINMQALSTSEDPNAACLPFDKRRGGFVIGEGGAALVLEEYEHAVKRGAKIYGEVCGYGATCDAFHITAPRPDGSAGARAIQLALQEAGHQAGERVYINAHGTGTPMNDSLETQVVKLALGEEEAKKAYMSSTKSMTGHMLGAAGAIEALACLKARRSTRRWTWFSPTPWALAATTPALPSGR